MTVEGLLNWHTFRVTAKDRWYRKAYSEKVVAATADQALAGCRAAVADPGSLIDWQVKIIDSGDVKVVHLV
jgi:hypothetical protein